MRKMDKLLEILGGIKPGVDFTAVGDLIGEHVLDSMSIVLLVGELNEEFDIDITPVDIIPENFKNVNTIMALIERLTLG